MQSQTLPVAGDADGGPGRARQPAEGKGGIAPGPSAIPGRMLDGQVLNGLHAGAGVDPIGDSLACGACVADEAPTLIWATDAAGGLIYANRRFEAVFGIPSHALQGDGWGLILLPDALVQFRADLRQAIAGQLPFRVEVQVRTAGGPLRWHRCEAIPKTGPAGTLVGYVGCNVDITEGRDAEAALRELNATLERRVTGTHRAARRRGGRPFSGAGPPAPHPEAGGTGPALGRRGA